MSMAGIPFMAGFYAKWVVLQAVVDVGLVWLAILGVVFSVIGAFYYLRVVVLYFDKPEQSAPIELSRDTEIVISANGLLLVVLGLYPTALMSWCATALLNQASFGRVARLAGWFWLGLWRWPPTCLG